MNNVDWQDVDFCRLLVSTGFLCFTKENYPDIYCELRKVKEDIDAGIDTSFSTEISSEIWIEALKEFTGKENKQYLIPKSSEILLPIEFGKAPLFAAQEQKNVRLIKCQDKLIMIGVPNPQHDKNLPYYPALSIEHGIIIFRLLDFYLKNHLEFYETIRISYNELLKICDIPKNSRNLRKIKKLLSDLRNTWWRTETQISSKRKEIKHFTVIRDLDTTKYKEKENEDKEYLDSFSFSENFINLFLNYDPDNIFHFEIEELQKMSSDLARAIYTYIPSRAIHRSAARPFKIQTRELLKQTGATIPRYKGLRTQKFTQNKNSVIKQLDNALLKFNQKLRCKIEPEKTRDDNVVFWVENWQEKDIDKISASGKLLEWFITGGGNEKEYNKKIKQISHLNSYEIRALEYCDIDIKKNEKFLIKAKALVPEFSEICGELKEKFMLSQIDIKTKPIYYFIGLIRRQLTRDFFS